MCITGATNLVKNMCVKYEFAVLHNYVCIHVWTRSHVGSAKMAGWVVFSLNRDLYMCQLGMMLGYIS